MHGFIDQIDRVLYLQSILLFLFGISYLISAPQVQLHLVANPEASGMQDNA